MGSTKQHWPLISCIMPTANRKDFLAQAIIYFQAQDYPNKELVIVEDGDEFNWEIALGLNYHYIPGKYSIGWKRNFACEMARGAIFCHWDDDDYYGPHRLSLQAEPLLNRHADVTGFRMEALLDIDAGAVWTCSEEAHQALFPLGVRCGTLMYKSAYWRAGLRYQDSSAGEDVQFLRDLLAQEARLEEILDADSYACVRHGSNISAPLSPQAIGGKRRDLEDYLPQEHLAFYRGQRELARSSLRGDESIGRAARSPYSMPSRAAIQ